MATPHVLLVDDSCVDCFVASRVLKSCNIQVTTVEGPKQALKFLDMEHDVQLILTDYCMPDMTGYDLLVEVKKSSNLNHLPVVITCTDDDRKRMKKCLDGGAKDYITKPIKVVDVPRLLSYI
ncbi:Two-component response regulator ORR12 [Dichanthelium oligosanthes]|uniref:Two-component response regulator ORR12 n=1 Tax=Dichanthelium oligosanthes TaxID=888268 RepID=A0A1E5W8H0_9POAL|nr:Two-component response regulator ORR12 [Dichanthelium oligosanthes]